MASPLSDPLAPPGEAEPIPTQTEVADWLRLIRAEYLEIPDLQLTRHQVRRLWGLDELMCDLLLERLVEAGFLRQTRGGAYIRVD